MRCDGMKGRVYLPGTSERKALPMHYLVKTKAFVCDCRGGRGGGRRKGNARVNSLPRGQTGLFCDHHLVMKLVGKHLDKAAAVGVVSLHLGHLIQDRSGLRKSPA